MEKREKKGYAYRKTIAVEAFLVKIGGYGIIDTNLRKIPMNALSKYPDYEVNIGIEIHVQLTTKSKIFCSCPNGPGLRSLGEVGPNSHICQICTGQPGTLPVLNKEVVNYGIMAALATNSKINHTNRFARKHYFYPDLPKGFQITQSDVPLCQEGYVTIVLEDGSSKKIRLTRIHMEEDAGKNIHAAQTAESFVDLNRAGTPLLEMVSYPDISSAYEARAYLKALRSLVMYLDICSGNMEEGAFRADTNISVRKKGAEKLGTKCELKNINSFKFISDAIEYEIERQIALIESGGAVRQETRLWDTKEHKTVTMRSKEEAADYRYLTEPDIPPLVIDDAWVAAMQKKLPELPAARFDRLVAQGLTPYEAEIIVNDRELAHYYEAAYAHNPSKQLINWVLRDVMGYVKEHKIELSALKVTPVKLAELVKLIDSGAINARAGQEMFAAVAATGDEPQALIEKLGLAQIGSADELEKLIKEIIDANPSQVAEYKAGKTKLWGFFVGAAMAKTKGRGNPQMINDLLKKYLS